MSWLMYATRSTSRTIFPSSVSGSRSPVCVRIPSHTSCVRLSERAIRSDCSLWRKRRPKRSWTRRVERVLAGVPERRVAHVVPEPDRLGQVLVQPQRPRDDARDRRRLERVGHARAVVVALRVDEDLRLPLQPPERLRVDDAVAVALERRAHAALLLGKLATARLERADRERRQALLERADPLLERLLRRSGDLHPVRVVRATDSRRDAEGDEAPLRRRTGPRTRARAPCTHRTRAPARRPPRRRSNRAGAPQCARRSPRGGARARDRARGRSLPASARRR